MVVVVLLLIYLSSAGGDFFHFQFFLLRFTLLVRARSAILIWLQKILQHFVVMLLRARMSCALECISFTRCVFYVVFLYLAIIYRFFVSLRRNKCDSSFAWQKCLFLSETIASLLVKEQNTFIVQQTLLLRSTICLIEFCFVFFSFCSKF